MQNISHINTYHHHNFKYHNNHHDPLYNYLPIISPFLLEVFSSLPPNLSGFCHMPPSRYITHNK